MGNLLKETPESETHSTLEVLDRFEVSRADLKAMRSDEAFGRLVAEFIKSRGWAKPEAPYEREADLEVMAQDAMAAPSDKLVKVLEPVDTKPVLVKWQKFCREVFDREIDPSKLTVPAARGDINFPLVITESLATIIAKCRERFAYWQWMHKDSKLVKSGHTAEKGAYVVLIRNTVEADEIHKDKSANALNRAGIIGITLEERLTYELFYHWDTGGRHLDLETTTLCAGSRGDDGSVPYVDFDDDDVRVRCCLPDYYDAGLRVREAVSAAT